MSYRISEDGKLEAGFSGTPTDIVAVPSLDSALLLGLR